jgi:hypothetical protein
MRLNIKLILALMIITTISCVQEIYQKTITFKVNMNGVENISDVGVRGTFTNWEETFFLNDKNGNGIYEGVLSKKSASKKIEFKFVNQEKIYELNNLNNRIINLKNESETIIYEANFDNPEFKIVKN